MGKTAIHPSQLPVIEDALKVRKNDYEDAKRIMGWTGEKYAVQKSASGGRMNEVKCHSRWANKMLILADIYGVYEEEG